MKSDKGIENQIKKTCCFYPNHLSLTPHHSCAILGFMETKHVNKDGNNIVGLTIDEVKKICRGHGEKDRTEELLCVIEEELEQGFKFAKDHPETVTIFGSARTHASEPYYDLASTVASKIVTDLGYSVITGGGPGIMEGANKGASVAGGHSLGMAIKLPVEQDVNKYVNEAMHFHFFFTRKVVMSYTAKAFIAFPGGFGTLNEFFEVLTLVQTKKIPPVPIILFGREFWEPLQSYIESTLSERGFIDVSDPHLLYFITDDPDEVILNIKNFYQ